MSLLLVCVARTIDLQYVSLYSNCLLMGAGMLMTASQSPIAAAALLLPLPPAATGATCPVAHTGAPLGSAALARVPARAA